MSKRDLNKQVERVPIVQLACAYVYGYLCASKCNPYLAITRVNNCHDMGPNPPPPPQMKAIPGPRFLNSCSRRNPPAQMTAIPGPRFLHSWSRRDPPSQMTAIPGPRFLHSLSRRNPLAQMKAIPGPRLLHSYNTVCGAKIQIHNHMMPGATFPIYRMQKHQPQYHLRLPGVVVHQ